MTNEQINRELAEKMMGFIVDSIGILDNRPGGGYITDWNPSENIRHAMMCLEKFGDWMLEKTSNGQYYCRIGWGFSEGSWATTPTEAISLACLEAVKEK